MKHLLATNHLYHQILKPTPHQHPSCSYTVRSSYPYSTLQSAHSVAQCELVFIVLQGSVQTQMWHVPGIRNRRIGGIHVWWFLQLFKVAILAWPSRILAKYIALPSDAHMGYRRGTQSWRVQDRERASINLINKIKNETSWEVAVGKIGEESLIFVRNSDTITCSQ